MSIKHTLGTTTRQHLRSAITRNVSNLTSHEASKILDELFIEITNALVRGEDVRLRGFGVFKIQHKNLRIGRNPITGVDAVITPRRVIKFSASPYFKAIVNGEMKANRSDEDES
jgi:integration host factor subunit alpha